ncbi:hypothetical protein EDM80_07510 [bacterium]|nr:MAG: hypothetical protein EDM80_07510 [bacterium]RIK62744.1 MAG: hypothetical protein DCC64_09300 [Planctomycetota bacterium]
MGREHLDILMNRVIDGVASPAEREELARALDADPTLRAEFDELKAAHSSTLLLFERLSLPGEFTGRVMRRVQPDHVPTDADLTAIIESGDLPKASEPTPSPARSLLRSQMIWRRKANLAAVLSSVGAFSAAAALLLAIGMLTGIIGPNRTPPQAPVAGKADSPKPAARVEPAPQPAVREPAPPAEVQPPPEPQPRDARPGHEEDEDDREVPPPAPEQPQGEVRRETETPAREQEDPSSELPGTAPGPSVETPEEPVQPPTPSETPRTTNEPGKSGPTVEEPERRTGGGTVEPREQPLWGRLVSISSGNLSLVDEAGKAVRISDGTELRVGQRLQTNVNGLSVLSLSLGGYVAAGRKTTFVLTRNGITLEEGELAVDFDGTRGQQLQVAFDAYTLALTRGTLLLEKKTRRKMAIAQSAGVAALRHGENSLALEGSLEVDVEYGKMPSSARARAVILPDWCGNARAEISLSRVEKLLAERKFSSSVDRRLRSVIATLSKAPVSTELLVAFLRRVLEEPAFSVPDLVSMLESIVEALNSMPELSANAALQLAAESLCECKSLSDWARRFDLVRANWLKREAKEVRKPEHKVEGKGDSGDVKDATPGADEKRGKDQAGNQGK